MNLNVMHANDMEDMHFSSLQQREAFSSSSLTISIETYFLVEYSTQVNLIWNFTWQPKHDTI